MMSREVSRALIEKAARAGEGAVSFLFQGGEPTLAGLDFFRDFVSCVAGTFPKDLRVRYALQTNGLLLDEDWCRFFRENGVLVGLSLDGTRVCHDRFRRDSQGNGSYDRALQALRLLARTGVEHNVLTVVTGYLARHVQGVFTALCRGGCRRERLAEQGGPGRNRWCESYAGFFPYALPRLRRAAELLRRG